jgi:hypothetical protein
MPIRSTVADWTRHPRHHPVAGALGRVAFGGRGKATRPAGALAVEEGPGSAAPAIAQRSEPPGTAGGLTRILTALTRQAYAARRDRQRARANADLLLETIRLNSIL